MDINFSQHVLDVFSANDTNYDELKNLMIDYACKKDGMSEGVSRSEARDKIYDISLQIFGLTKEQAQGKDKKVRRRAIRDNSRAFFDIIEEVEDYKFITGFQEGDFYLSEFVEYRNTSKGDQNLFLSNDDSLLVVTKTAGNHHDITMQPISVGSYYSVEVATYTAKVGLDLDLYIRGSIDFNDLIQRIYDAYTRKTQESIYAEWLTAADKLPSGDTFVGSGALDTNAKAGFDKRLYNVQAANPDAEVVIVGTQQGVSQINNLVLGGAIAYPSEAQKTQIATNGYLANYGAHRVIALPNRFEDKTFSKKVYDDDVIFFIPLVSDNTGKPIKFIDEGDTDIIEDDDIKDTIDEFRTFAIRKSFGVSSNLSRMFGKWTIVNA